uniref:DNA polymerase alpha subunit B n=1 Tax=Scleropages formosus TaxID=113540 RepID=A0A8D0CFT8_SCLFO
MTAVSVEDIRAGLAVFDDLCEDDQVLDRMLEQCICHQMDCDDLINEWVAFSTTKGGLKLTLDILEQFEHEVTWVAARRRLHCRSFKRIPVEEEEILLDSYSTPAKGSQKRALTTPEHPQSKRSTSSMLSPRLLLSPASFSAGLTPSQKYSSRGARGEVVSTFGTVQGTRWVGKKGKNAIRVELLEGQDQSLGSSYKFMFQRLRDIRNVLIEKIEELGEELRSHFKIEEFSPVTLPAQDPITVLGQVCCDSNGKLNAQSVLLEAGQDQGGKRVPLDLSELKEYSLFPGQVVIMEGMNTTGNRLVPSKLYEVSVRLLHPHPIPNPEPVMVMVACGPYTPSDSLNYDPLLDLIGVITRDHPDVCILKMFYPLQKCQLTESYEALFLRCVDSIIQGTRGVGCHLVFVPSQRDVHHHFVYPQPPFIMPGLSKEDKERVSLVSDPSTLLIGGVTFGLTSTDIFFHMGAEEISSSDRFTRIVKHMLTQRSYYPLYPPAEEINLDYERFQIHGQMLVTPDVLIVPSELRYFIKDVIGCVCINPGRLTKGQVGGTYGRLLIQRSPPSADGKRQSPCIASQVVKI